MTLWSQTRTAPFYVPPHVVEAFMKTGFQVQEFTQAELLQRVVVAIRELDDPLRTSLLAAVAGEQLRHNQHP